MRASSRHDVLIDVLALERAAPKLLAELLCRHALRPRLEYRRALCRIRPGEETKTESSLQSLESFDVTGATPAGWNAQKHLGQKRRTLALVDMIVAATAIEHDCMLVTDNRKDFPMQELRLYPLP